MLYNIQIRENFIVHQLLLNIRANEKKIITFSLNTLTVHV
jgi:hypothetical protein